MVWNWNYPHPLHLNIIQGQVTPKHLTLRRKLTYFFYILQDYQIWRNALKPTELGGKEMFLEVEYEIP